MEGGGQPADLPRQCTALSAHRTHARTHKQQQLCGCPLPPPHPRHLPPPPLYCPPLPQGPKNPLQTRLLFHCAQRQGNDSKLMSYHQQLTESLEDQLSLAAVHYQRSHFQEATDIYKRLLMDNRSHVALNVSTARRVCSEH